MSENTQNQNPKQEQYSLNDDRRVKVLSPGALVAKRFFRNRLAVVGLSILVAMFLFSFVGGLVSPYGQDEQFFTYTQMSKEFVGVTRNDTMRFVVADGQNFGSIAQSKALEAVKKGNTEFNYKDVDYTVDIQSDDFYVVYQGRDIMGYASRDLVNEADGAPKFSFDVKLAALTAMTAGEKEFAADGVPNDLRHTRGVLSMARAQAMDSAGSQFFIMHADGEFLDGQYAAFGMVTEGMDVVDRIAATKTGMNDKPKADQRMKKVTVETFGVDYPEPEKL